MLRSILVGLLVISAASACKGGSAAPKVEPGATVGNVVELTGKVTATRGTATRTLDATSTVSGDDVITTGADGRVTIRLAHNNAKWALGPNKHEQVSESMAWQLAKADSPAAAVDETTTTAGRHAERSAATSESSAPAATDEEKQPKLERDKAPAPTAAAASTPPPPSESGGGGPSTGSPAPGGAPSGGKPLPPPPPPPPPPAPPNAKLVGKTGTKGSATITAPTKTKDTGAANTKALEDLLDSSPRPGGTTRSPTATADKNADESAPTGMKAAIERERSAMRACVVASGKDKLSIVFHLDGGKTSIELKDGTDADRACFAKIAARIKLTVEQPTNYALTVDK